ncbi:MAG TPA: lysozyme inhibitor LprI family protein [Silvibacterium sp.]|nr:lysozyme inhibitor LprI family protein [Silvibacterium sp.]
MIRKVLLRVMKRMATILMAIASVIVQAYPQHMNAKDSPCRKVVITADLANCLWTKWHSEDKELNAYYQSVSQHLHGDELTDLRDAENTWISFRQANCKAEKSLYGGGTAVGPVYNACMEATTRHRVAELKTMYDWRLTK